MPLHLANMIVWLPNDCQYPVHSYRPVENPANGAPPPAPDRRAGSQGVFTPARPAEGRAQERLTRPSVAVGGQRRGRVVRTPDASVCLDRRAATVGIVIAQFDSPRPPRRGRRAAATNGGGAVRREIFNPLTAHNNIRSGPAHRRRPAPSRPSPRSAAPGATVRSQSR